MISSDDKEFSILEERKKPYYRLLESSLGIASYTFLFLIIILSFFKQEIVAVILILYSFLWILKFALSVNYTIYTYIQVRRWEKFDWDKFSQFLKKGNRNKVIAQLEELRDQYKGKIDWKSNLNYDITRWQEIEGTEYENPLSIKQVAIFSIYNESFEVIKKSLKHIYKSKYPYQNLIVLITQEQRIGKDHIDQLIQSLTSLSWVSFSMLQENNYDIVYSSDHQNLEYSNPAWSDIELRSDKLNILFTQHPDGLVGEIKGKSSNEDWAGRQMSLFVKAKKYNPNHVLITSFDADSHAGEYFFHNLSYRYCLNDKKETCGYQPVHVYSNNYFDTGLWQRQIATQNALSNMMYLGVDNQTHFFAIYSVPLFILQEINFWVREVIAEDYTIYAKCIAFYGQKFRVIPYYGVFEGDAVEADDYIESLIFQYRQLQRWTWGGVESFPYLFYMYFVSPHRLRIPLRVRINYCMNLFSEHFFWATTPFVLSLGVALPQFIGGEQFQQKQIAQNLSNFVSYFSWISLLFLIIFSYITYRYIVGKAKQGKRKTLGDNILFFLQWFLMPFMLWIGSIPALDSQLRGIRGKYLGYWVTPKK